MCRYVSVSVYGHVSVYICVYVHARVCMCCVCVCVYVFCMYVNQANNSLEMIPRMQVVTYKLLNGQMAVILLML